jgi:hypothetical protein
MLIIAIGWAAGEAAVLPYWPQGERVLGTVGWVVAVFAGCSVAQAKARGIRFSYPAERVALAAMGLAAAGELAAAGIGWGSGPDWADSLLRAGLAVLAMAAAVRVAGMAVKARRTSRYEAYAQRTYYIGEALLKERE